MQETFDNLAKVAIYKKNLLESSKVGYLLVTALGGLFIGFGIVILVVIGGLLDPAGVPGMKIIQGLAFGIALCMVMMGGADLFTGNNLVMTIGVLEKKTSWWDLVKVWGYSYGGNFIGSFICAAFFVLAGLATGATGDYIEKISIVKTGASFTELLFRGILCNTLVCLAVWCTYRLKSESAKIALIFCCIFPFITSGFEHSVANMTLFTMAMMISDAITFTDVLHNLIPVTLGNMIGGAIVIGGAFWHSYPKNDNNLS